MNSSSIKHFFTLLKDKTTRVNSRAEAVIFSCGIYVNAPINLYDDHFHMQEVYHKQQATPEENQFSLGGGAPNHLQVGDKLSHAVYYQETLS